MFHKIKLHKTQIIGTYSSITIGILSYFKKYLLTLSDVLRIGNSMADINRIKVVLAEKKRTSKWLAQQVGKEPATVSKWCTNTAQPSLETLIEVAKVLEVDVRELIEPTDHTKVILKYSP